LRRSFTIVSLCCASFGVLAQAPPEVYEKYQVYRSPLRLFLNKFTLTATTGYGQTYYKHDLNGYYFFQDPNGQYIRTTEGGIGADFQGYSGWLGNPALGPSIALNSPFTIPFPPGTETGPELADGQILLNGDETDFGFRGIGHDIPINLQLHFNFMEKFRVGIGYSWQKQLLGEFAPTAYESFIRPYDPGFNSTRYTRFYGMAGYQFYEYRNHAFVGELQVGKARSGPRQFNRDFVDQGMFVNVGVSIEQIWSEYFRLIVRPSVEFKGYQVNMPEGPAIRNGNPTYMVNVGASIRFPRLPRSPIANDKIQVEHTLLDPTTGRRIEVRGQPLTKWQNPKVGQNHRKLERYKRKNKRKIHPY
jgi:hypothetical protein